MGNKDAAIGFDHDGAERVMAAMRRVLAGVDDWRLAALDSLTATGRSLVIGLAVAMRHLGPEEALALMRLEEQFQADHWGSVDGGHDVDEADMRARVAGAISFLHLIEDI